MEKKNFRIEHWMIITAYLIVYDVIAAELSFFIALWFRFDCRFEQIPSEYFAGFLQFAPIYAIVCVIIFWRARLYNSIWRFASYSELCRMTLATGLALVIHVVMISLLYGRMPVSYYIFGTMIQFGLTLGIRFSYRFILLLRGQKASKNVEQLAPKNILLIGAGEAGQSIQREIKRSREINGKVCAFIDDNSNKWGRYVEGVKVVGGRESIPEACDKYDITTIYCAIPSASAKDRKEILMICNNTGRELKSLPGMYQLMTDQVSVSDMKDVNVEDLLGREPIHVNMEEIYQFIQGKVIMVTGGGGSIGSELCRQIAAHNPKKLIIFDVYENNAYDIQFELLRQYPFLKLECIIGSVRDSRKLWQVFETYKPDVVYHAAAHKHVPLMEDSPCEAIKNNALGTYKTAYAAMVHGCKRFVLISTDKAVNPTNIMGASKRICEMIVQSFDKKIKEGRAEEIPQLFTHAMNEKMKNENTLEALKNAKTEFVAVRFGNVLGSNGSVIPLFKKQIAEGGPVTVTHPEIIRYFMTIPEAVSLVLQAGVFASGGEIFVLDMGEPVKIDTLARNLIRLSGHKPDEDIKIIYTGLRPGEKLYEEKLMAEEGLDSTPNHLIHIGHPIPFEEDLFFQQLKDLMDAAYRNLETIRDNVAEIVTTYKPM